MTISPMRDPLNAFLDLPEVPVEHAADGPLAGLTLGVKDIVDVREYVSGWGNPDHAAEAGPARTTASAVQTLLDAGARFVGKTQTEELAFSMIGQNVHFPHPVNSAAPDRVTGGSSSGSVAAITGGLCDIATGSDTGGSVRAPGSFCGLMGLRTTHGLIPLDHTMALAPSFDTFGWFARDNATYETVGKLLLGNKAASELKQPRFIHETGLEELLSGPAEAEEYRRMKERLAGLFGEAKKVAPLPYAIDDLYWATRRLQAREAWDAHGTWISKNGERMGKAVYDRFAFGKTVTPQDVETDTRLRTDFAAALTDMLGNDGVLVIPTVPGAAPRSDASPDEMGEYRERAVRLMCWSGLSGLPQITIPLGTVEGAPFGISLLGPAGSDIALIRLARHAMEGSAPWTH